LITGALRPEPCASHRKARWRVPARWIQGKPTDRPPRRVGVLAARRRPGSLLPRSAMNRHSMHDQSFPTWTKCHPQRGGKRFPDREALQRDVPATPKQVEQTLVTDCPVGIMSPAGISLRPRRGWITSFNQAQYPHHQRPHRPLRSRPRNTVMLEDPQHFSRLIPGPPRIPTGNLTAFLRTTRMGVRFRSCRVRAHDLSRTGRDCCWFAERKFSAGGRHVGSREGRGAGVHLL